MAGRRRSAIILLLAAPILLASAASADFFSPLQVELSMPEYPSVGGEGTLDCVIRSRYKLENVSLAISLSDGLVLTKGSASWQGGIGAFQEISLPLAVRVVSEGNKTIRATVFCRVDESTAYSDIAQVFFHSGVAWSAVGHVTDYVPTETEAVCLQTGEMSLPTKLADAMRRPAAAGVPDPCTAGPGDPQPTAGGPPVEGLLTVTGRWCYYDRADTLRPMEWVYVELRRGDTDAVLAGAWITDNDGQYTFPPVTNPGAAGFRVRAWCFHNNTHSSDGKALRVVDVGAGRDDGGNDYSICYSVQTAVRTSADGTYDMGTWNVVNGSTNEPAWWIMMDLNKGFWWPYWWNDHTTMNGGVTVEWSSTSTHGDHNHRTDDGGNIHLKAASPSVCDVVLHEYGHEVQWDGYGQWLPSSDCPSPHYFELVGGPHCAWYEGFANWYKFAVTDDPVYHWAGGGTLNCETPTWGTAGWDNGDEVEGRTAGAMWDIGDSNADGYDTCQLSWEYIWDTWYGSANRDNTFSEFWTRWKNKGQPKHHSVKALYQNTIDYDTTPTFSGLPDRSTNEDTPYNNALDLWLYAYDPESYDSELEYTITGNTNPNCGVTVDSSGYVDINPVPDWYGTSTVTIRCSDGIRDASDSFVVTVNSVNDPPTISGIPDKLVARNSSNNNALDLWVYADDVETSDANLIYTITANTNASCGVSIDPDDYVDINPTSGWTGYSDVTIRVTDPGGLWAEDTFRIVVAIPFEKISQARANPNTTWVWVSNKISTAKFDEMYYIEEANRSSGIRVASAAGPEPGRYVTVAGQLSTSYAERLITPYYTSIGAAAPAIAPLGVKNDSLGGGGPDANTVSVPENGSGAYNVGLLVRTWGRVTQHASGGRFYITDGGSVKDNASGAASVFVYGLPSGYQPPVGSYVSVTGISSASTLGGKPMRVLRPRTDSDIQVRWMSAAFIYDTAPADAQSFKNLLDGNGVPTTMVPLSKVTTVDLSRYQVILIGNDTGLWTNPANVNAVLAPGTPVIAIGQGGGFFLDAVTSPSLYIGWGNSAFGSNETHAIVQSGDIYSYPYVIPYTPGQNIYLFYSPGTAAVTLWDPGNSAEHFLADYHVQGYYPVCAEYDRFYQWGYCGPPSTMTGWGHQLFVNLVWRTARH